MKIYHYPGAPRPREASETPAILRAKLKAIPALVHMLRTTQAPWAKKIEAVWLFEEKFPNGEEDDSYQVLIAARYDMDNEERRASVSCEAVFDTFFPRGCFATNYYRIIENERPSRVPALTVPGYREEARARHSHRSALRPLPIPKFQGQWHS